MSWVIVIPKEGLAGVAVPALLLVWHQLFTKKKKKKKKKKDFSKFFFLFFFPFRVTQPVCVSHVSECHSSKCFRNIMPWRRQYFCALVHFWIRLSVQRTTYQTWIHIRKPLSIYLVPCLIPLVSRVGHEDRWKSSTMRPRTQQWCPRPHEAEDRDFTKSSSWGLRTSKSPHEDIWGQIFTSTSACITEFYWSDKSPHKCPHEFCWGLCEVSAVLVWGRGQGQQINLTRPEDKSEAKNVVLWPRPRPHEAWGPQLCWFHWLSEQEISFKANIKAMGDGRLKN